MPVGTNGRWYDDPTDQVAADLGPTYIAAAGTTNYAFSSEDFDTILGTLQTHEFLLTALTGADNDMVIIARAGGVSALTIALVDPSANDASLSVSKTDDDIVVSLATDDEGAITSTASQVVAALNSDADSAPHVYAQVAPSNSGAGVVTALAETGLGAWTGTSPTLDVSLETTSDGTNYFAAGTAFAQKTTAAADESRAFSGLGTGCRWKAVAGGTTPGLVFSINARGKE